MPTTIQSDYEIDRSEQRRTSQQHKKLRKVTAGVRDMVEDALSLNAEAKRDEKRLNDFASDTEGFRARAQADRRDWMLLWVFWGTILAYTVLEFMTSGDVAEMLACQMAPLFGVDPVTGEMPIWLRRGAGVGFVAAMLLATLLAKLISGYVLNALKTAKGNLSRGENARYFWLNCGVLGIYLGKLAYVGAVATLYFWLFGFAQQRAAIMTDLAAGQKQDAGLNGLAIKIEDGAIPQQEAAPLESQAAPAGETVSRLAGATGVFYAAIVLLHAFVLVLPTKGFSRELELAHFKKGVAEKRVAKLRGNEGQTLRAIYEHVRIAPEQYRSELVEATEPVHAAINKLYGRRVIGISGISNPPGSNPDGMSAGMDPSPSSPYGPNGGVMPHGANGHNHVTSAVPAIGTNGTTELASETEAPAMDWDAIFPSRQA